MKSMKSSLTQALECLIKRLGTPLVIVALGPLLLLGRMIIRGEALFWGTPVLQFYPWRAYAWESLLNGSLPLWNPLNGMGAPLVANYQLALFYPPGWLLYGANILGGTGLMAWAHTLLAAAHLAWAGWGMARLARKIGLHDLGQAVSGLAFSLGGYLVARQGFFSMIWAAAWLPWIVIAAEDMTEQGRSFSLFRIPPIRLVIYLSLMLLAGHAQLSWYVLLLVGAWAAWRGWQLGGMGGMGSAVLNLGGAGVCAGLIASVQLLPTFEYLMQSQRSVMVDYEIATGYSFWPWRFITLLAPNFYGNPGHGDYWGYANYWEDAIYIGLLSILLALGTIKGIFAKGEKNGLRPLLIFLWFLTAVGILLALGVNTPVFPWLYRHVPSFDMFNAPARYLIWASFSLSLLAGIGATRWTRPHGRALYWTRLATAGAVAVSLGAWLAWYSAGEDIRLTFIRATALAGLWGLGVGILALTIPPEGQLQRRNIWQWLVVSWICCDLLVAGLWLNPGIEKSYFTALPSDAPPELLRKQLDGQRLYVSASDEYHLKFDRFLTFENFSLEEDWINMRYVLLPNLNLMEGIASANNFDPLVPGRFSQWMVRLNEMDALSRQPWLAMMNVGMVEVVDETEMLGVRFDPVAGGERFRWFGCAVWAADSESAWNEVNLLMMNFKPELPDFLILEGGTQPFDRIEECNSNVGVEITPVSETPNRITVKVNTPVDGWLMIADTWYPGWRLRVDQKSVEQYRANYLFRAAAVPAGEHEITWVYQPVSFYAGAGISGLGIVLLFLAGWFRRS